MWPEQIIHCHSDPAKRELLVEAIGKTLQHGFAGRFTLSVFLHVLGGHTHVGAEFFPPPIAQFSIGVDIAAHGEVAQILFVLPLF